MSEHLLSEQMDRMSGQAERATGEAAKARAELSQVGDLLTALGVAMTTKPEGEDRTSALASPFFGGEPRTLSLTERIMALAEGETGPAFRFTTSDDGADIPGPVTDELQL